MSHVVKRMASRVGVEMKALLAWGYHELRALCELFVLRIAPRFATRASIQIQMNGNGGEIWVMRGSQREHVCDFRNGDALQIPSALCGAHASIVLSEDEVLTHELWAPLAARRELHGLVELHLERELPIVSGQFSVCHQIIARDRDARRLHVRILVAHRSRIEQVHRMAQECGLVVSRIGMRGGGAEMNGNFLRHSSGVQQLNFSSADRKLAASAAMLLLGCLGVIAVQWTLERIQVGKALRPVEESARRAEHLAKELGRQSAPGAAVARLSAMPDAAGVLPELTELVPADSWVYRLDVNAAFDETPRIKLAGVAPAAAVLAETLQKSSRFQDVRLTSAVAIGFGSSGDRFELAAEWKSP